MGESVKGHIVFDCDGTLISSHDKIMGALKLLVEEELKKPVTIQFIEERYTTRLDKCFANFGIDIRDADRLNKRWQELDHQFGYDFELYEGIQELLEKLIDRGFKLYVWTARGRASTIEILKNLKVISLFEDLRCGDDTIRKPHPMGLSEMVGAFDKKEVMMVGDSYSDIEGAKNFGCESIGAVWGDHENEEELRDIGATYIARNACECLPVIEKHFK